MKQTKMLVNWLVASAVAFAMVTSAQAAERIGKVVRIKGSARYSLGNNVWQPLPVGTLLRAGAIVQTAKESYVDIVLSESDKVIQPPTVGGVGVGAGAGGNRPAMQDIVRVDQDSVLAIDKLTAVDTGADKVTETQLDLRSGRILGSVKKMSAASRFEVKIPNGVAGIRGTLFAISADGVVAVAIGQVVISWTKADGSVGTQTVDEGWQYDIRTGQLSRIPEAALKPIKDFQLSGFVNFTTPTPLVVDQTIFNVSPTQGGSAPTPPPPPGNGSR